MTSSSLAPTKSSNRKFSLKIFKTALMQWWDNDPFTQSAAVAYYTIFSFPALIILYFSLASVFLNKLELQQQVFSFLQNWFGESGASLFKNIIENTAPTQTEFWPFVIAGIVLVGAALRLFMQLQKALNYVWKVDDHKLSGFRTLIVRRVISFAVMIAVLFVLCISLLVTSVINSMTSWLINMLPDFLIFFTHFFNILISLLIITSLFTVILKKLPDIDLKWRTIFPGAFIAGALFLMGEYLLGIYFGTAKPASAYGVTGSIILLMIWVSYSCSILLFGAEYTKVLYDTDN